MLTKRFLYAIKSFFLFLLFPVLWRFPATKRGLLKSLVGEQIEASTPFGFVSGTLLSTKKDYIVLIDETETQVFVRIDKIETIQSF
ncbi:hypothetical protein JCM19046_1960 [Bacillus sp. JCM 19046]|nr:hypothetical protein JCM19045_4935 [Bacillus sp. JCM 19045]GAF17447.1 hypothetical protein JCM19046_1960 [Bacillus sp. JCM 19046]